MKNAVLAMSTRNTINIGDYIQGLAAAQFFDKIDLRIERERLNTYDGDECNMIMNGWYMHEPKNWPPSPLINPLFVAFHINSLTAGAMLSSESIAYLKEHQPIGCRDKKTMNALNEKGVDAYFTGCMTLTLGETYKNTKDRKGLFFVDPYANVPKTVKCRLKYIALFFFNFYTCLNIFFKDFHSAIIRPVDRMVLVSSFVHSYKKIFGRKKLRKAQYISQARHKFRTPQKNNEAHFQRAEEILNIYANAEQVVTTRIHCALPCLGMGTPVVYVKNTTQEDYDSCRLDGLVDLFNVVEWDSKECKLIESPMTEMLSKGEVIENKESWMPIKDKLVVKCKEFVLSCK